MSDPQPPDAPLLEIAGVGTRCLAALIDYTILSIPLILIVVLTDHDYLDYTIVENAPGYVLDTRRRLVGLREPL